MIAVALSFACLSQSPRAVPAPHEELEPTTSVLTGGDLGPYWPTLARRLQSPQGAAQCQVLAIPSLEAEWCVGVIWLPSSWETHDGTSGSQSPHVLLRRFRASLWSELAREIEQRGTGGVWYSDSNAASETLEHLEIPVDEWVAPISRWTVGVLSETWSGMLRRTRYAEPPMEGCYDGVTYYVGDGFRGGEVWSPEPETRAAAFVDLAERMCRLAEAPPVARGAIEFDLLTAAEKLKERILRADREERERR